MSAEASDHQTRTEEDETAPGFSAWVSGGDHPRYFYAGYTEEMDIVVVINNFGPGNITLDISWENVYGFLLKPQGNTTITVTAPQNETYNIKQERCNFTLSMNSSQPVSPPRNFNLSIQVTAIDWDSEILPESLDRNYTMEVRYEVPDTSFEIDDITTHRVIGEISPGFPFIPPFYTELSHLRFSNTGNVDYRFSCEIIPIDIPEGNFDVLYRPGGNETYYYSYYKYKSSINFDLEFIVEHLPSNFDISITVTPEFIGDSDILHNLTPKSRTFNITYEFIPIGEVDIRVLSLDGSYFNPGQEARFNVTIENKGNVREFYNITLRGIHDETNDSFSIVSIPEGLWLEPGELGYGEVVITVDSNPPTGYTDLKLEFTVNGSYGSIDTHGIYGVIYREKPFNPADLLAEEINEELDSYGSGFGYVIAYSICYVIPFIIVIIVVLTKFRGANEVSK